MLLDTYVERMMQRTARREAGVQYDLNPDNDQPTRYSLDHVNHHLGWLAIKMSERMRTLLPLNRLHSFLSEDIGEIKTGIITSPDVATMISAFIVALLMSASVVYSADNADNRVFILLGALLAPLTVLARTCWASLSDKVPFDSEFVNIAVVFAYLSLCFAIINMSVISTFSIQAHPMATGAIILSGLIIVILVDDSSDKSKRRIPRIIWIARRITIKLLSPAILIVGGVIFLTGGYKYVLYGVAASCVVTVFALIHKEMEDTLPKSSLTFIAVSAVTVLVGWFVNNLIGEPGLGDLILISSIGIGALFYEKGVAGVGLGLALAIILGQLVGGPPMAVYFSIVALLLGLFFYKKSYQLVERWLFNPILKLLLILTNKVCLRYSAFLDYAAETMLLKHVGLEYEFIHRLLRDHFAIRKLIPALFEARGVEQLKIIEQISRQGESSVETLAGLVTHPDSRVRKAAIKGLGRVATPRAVTILKERVEKDNDEAVRSEIVNSLVKLSDEDTAAIMQIAVEDRSPQVRRSVIAQRYYLERALLDEDDSVFDTMLVVLADDHISRLRYNLAFFTIRYEGLNQRVLREHKAIINDRLTRGLKADSFKIRLSATSLMGLTEDISFLPGIASMLRDNEEIVRISAARALAKMDRDKVIPEILPALDDSSVKVRDTVIQTIIQINKDYLADSGEILTDMQLEPSKKKDAQDGNAKTSFSELEEVELVNALLKALKDESPTVRQSAAFALQYFRGESVFSGLSAAVKDSHSNVRNFVIKSLARLEDQRAVPILIKALRATDKQSRLLAAAGLKNFHVEASLSALIRAARDRNSDVRLIAISSLATFHEAEAVSVLMNVLKDPRDRAKAATALGQTPNYSIVPNLLKWLESDNINLQISAIMALAEMKVTESVEQLLVLLNRQPNRIASSMRTFFGSRPIDIRPYVAIALGKMKQSNTLPNLLSLSDHETETLLAARAWALDRFDRDLVREELYRTLKQLTIKGPTEYIVLARVYAYKHHNKTVINKILMRDLEADLIDQLQTALVSDLPSASYQIRSLLGSDAGFLENLETIYGRWGLRGRDYIGT